MRLKTETKKLSQSRQVAEVNWCIIFNSCNSCPKKSVNLSAISAQLCEITLAKNAKSQRLIGELYTIRVIRVQKNSVNLSAISAQLREITLAKIKFI